MGCVNAAAGRTATLFRAPPPRDDTEAGRGVAEYPYDITGGGLGGALLTRGCVRRVSAMYLRTRTAARRRSPVAYGGAPSRSLPSHHRAGLAQRPIVN